MIRQKTVMKKRLVEVINHPKSVVELYLSDDCSQVTEVKCLPENRVKEYCYTTDDFFKRAGVPRSVKNKLAIAMSR